MKAPTLVLLLALPLGCGNGPAMDPDPTPMEPLPDPIDWPQEPEGFTWMSVIPRHWSDPNLALVVGGNGRSARLEYQRHLQYSSLADIVVANPNWRHFDYPCGIEADSQTVLCTPDTEATPETVAIVDALHGLQGPYRHISTGRGVACLLDDYGRVSCFGPSSPGPIPEDTGPVAQVGASEDYACVLTLDRRAFCWGRRGGLWLEGGPFEDLKVTDYTPEFPHDPIYPHFRGAACALNGQGELSCVRFHRDGIRVDHPSRHTVRFTDPDRPLHELTGWLSLGDADNYICGVYEKYPDPLCIPLNREQRPHRYSEARQFREFNLSCYIDLDGRVGCNHGDFSDSTLGPSSIDELP